MALKIRLRRMGRKKAPTYRIVVAESSMPRDGRFVENLGHYNPRTEPITLVVDRDKALAWIGKGATPTDTVQSLLKRAGVFGPAPTAAETAVEAVKSSAKKATKAVGGAASKAVKAVKSAASGVKETVQDAVVDAAGAVADVVEDVREKVADVVEDVREKVADVVEDVRERVAGDDEAAEAATPEAAAEPQAPEAEKAP